MSRRRFRWTLVSAFLALVCAALPAHGQEKPEDTSALEARLIQRIDSLLPLERAARVEAERAAAEREERIRLASLTRVDTLDLRGLRLVVRPEHGSEARAMVGRILDEYGPFDGTSAFDGKLMTFQWAHELEPIYIEDPTVARVELKRWRSATAVNNTIRTALGAMIQNDLLSSVMSSWVNQRLLPPEDLTVTYRELATIPARASQACLGGDAANCWTALGLVPATGNQLAQWYTPEERRAYVFRVLSQYPSTVRERPEYVGCISRADYSVCDEILQGDYWVRRWMAPLTEEARLSMLWLALERGGEGAWDRLMDALYDEDGTAKTDVTPAQALEAASGMTPNELGAAWRAMVLTHRPLVYAGSLPARFAPLLWMFLFAALAMRSTRWRLG